MRLMLMTTATACTRSSSRKGRKVRDRTLAPPIDWYCFGSAPPARRLPQALRLLLDVYRRQRTPGESFASWAARTPKEAVRDHLRDSLAVASPEPELFTDWGDTEPYSLQLGRGECAG